MLPPRDRSKEWGQTTAATAPLHVCPDCSSPLVQPIEWEQTPRDGFWRLTRRCPECEWSGEGVFSEHDIDAFDEQLDYGTRELAEELKALEYENMRRLTESFVMGLEADLIGADDFCR